MHTMIFRSLFQSSNFIYRLIYLYFDNKNSTISYDKRYKVIEKNLIKTKSRKVEKVEN